MRSDNDDEPAGKLFYHDGIVATTSQASSGSGGVSIPRFDGAINGHPMNTVATNGTFHKALADKSNPSQDLGDERTGGPIWIQNCIRHRLAQPKQLSGRLSAALATISIEFLIDVLECPP